MYLGYWIIMFLLKKNVNSFQVKRISVHEIKCASKLFPALLVHTVFKAPNGVIDYSYILFFLMHYYLSKNTYLNMS